jgi:hypothetical protein
MRPVQEIRYLALYEVEGKKPRRLRQKYKRYDISTFTRLVAYCTIKQAGTESWRNYHHPSHAKK